MRDRLGSDLSDPDLAAEPTGRGRPGGAARTDRLGGGQPLPGGVRGDLERATGDDLSDVLVHVDEGAAVDAAAIGAEAYTQGNHIVFGEGRFDPGSSAGRNLLAEEVGHVVQQRGGAAGEGGVSRPTDAAEVEARAFADAFSAGHAAELTRGLAPAGVAHRRTEDAPDAGREPIPEWEISSAVSSGKSGLEELSRHGYTRDGDGKPVPIPGMDLDVATAEQALAAAMDALAPYHGDKARALIRREGQPLLDRLTQAIERATAIVARARAKAAALQLEAIDAKLATRGQTLGQYAALYAERAAVEHQEKLFRTGKGHYAGSNDNDRETETTDCITYAMKTLGQAFAKVGQSSVWNQVKAVAYQRSRQRSPNGISGIDLMTALQDIGWVAYFIVADSDPTTMENTSSKHHMVELGMARGGRPMFGSRNGVPGVKAAGALTDYGPAEDSKHARNAESLARLRRLDVAFAAADGGRHTALLSKGQIWESHIGQAATSENIIEATSLETWAWKSMLIVAPPGDVARMKKPLTPEELDAAKPPAEPATTGAAGE